MQQGVLKREGNGSEKGTRQQGCCSTPTLVLLIHLYHTFPGTKAPLDRMIQRKGSKIWGPTFHFSEDISRTKNAINLKLSASV